MTPAPGRRMAGALPIARWEALGRPLPHLSRSLAALVLALLAATMAWSVIASGPADRAQRAPRPVVAATVAKPDKPPRARGDLALYSRIAARVSAGEDYYSAAMDEQRRSNYPTSPFVAVRQPSLTWLQAAIGVGGVRLIEMGLALACLAALWWRLRGVVTLPERLAALVLLGFGGAAVRVPLAGLIHELWAGLWLTLALLVYREDRWWPALVAAAMALAVRELALPFVLLWLAFALAARRWREAAAITALIAVFAGGMALHGVAVEAGRLPGDLASQGWDAFAGYGLPLMALRRLTGLAYLPIPLAAPLAVLPLLGWIAIGGRLGLFAGLWFAGLFTMIALFARPENFYWAQLALPAYGIGFAFAPRALIELWRGAARQT